MQKTVLIVDDSRVARMSLKKALMPHGTQIVEMSSAEEAFDYLATENNHPDMIFMDVVMEGLDGLAATKKIKATPELNTIPVVICTGNQSELDNEKARESGAIAVLTKPPVPEAVDDIMTALTRHAEVTPKEASPSLVDVDEATIAAKMLEAIEQKLWPKMTRESQHIAAEASYTKTKEIIEEQLVGQIQAELKALLPTLQSQWLTAVKQDVVANQVDEVNMDDTAQASDALEKQAEQDQVEAGIQTGSNAMGAVDVATVAQVSDESEQKLAELTERVSQLETIARGLVISAVVLAIAIILF